MSSIRLSDFENAIPDHFYRLVFNYAYYEKQDYSSDEDSKIVALETWTLYNKRHHVAGVLSLEVAPKLDDSGNNVGTYSYSGSLKLTPWAWGNDEEVKANRLGLERLGLFKFANYSLGTCVIEFTKGDTYYAITTTTASYYDWDEIGRKRSTRTIERASTPDPVEASNFNKLIAFLIENANKRTLVGNPPIFPENSATLLFGGFVKHNVVNRVTLTTYKEITAEIYDTVEVTFENKASDNTYKIVKDRVFQTIPFIARVKALDPGKWSLVNLTDTPMAALARYKGYVFNNTYFNLNNTNDVGFQQIYGFAEADYEYLWSRANSGNFGDIRSLKDTLFQYLPVIATLVCKHLRIRFAYINYVIAVITEAETFRGLYFPADTRSNIHGIYPWKSEIVSSYNDYLGDIFSLIKLDLSANDSVDFLKATYLTEVSKFNRWIFGETTVANMNVAKLGITHAARIGEYLKEYQAFVRRFKVANIDKALTEAYTNDMSFTGTVKIQDPAAVVSPGDSVVLNFLDDSLIPLKVMGANVEMSSNSLNYNIEVKRQW